MYRLYVDEVGTDGLTHLDKDKHRYLSLSGVAMKLDHAGDVLTVNMNWIKSNIFHHDPDTPLIFHRKEIMGFKGPFEVLRDAAVCDRFDKAILRLFEATEYTLITALIDKQWMLKQQHWSKTHPYHYLMEILVEKYVQFLERKQAIGDIMPESRQDKDALLQQAFDEVRAKGTDFVDKARIANAVRASKLKFRTKLDNIAGLSTPVGFQARGAE